MLHLNWYFERSEVIIRGWIALFEWQSRQADMHATLGVVRDLVSTYLRMRTYISVFDYILSVLTCVQGLFQ